MQWSQNTPFGGAYDSFGDGEEAFGASVHAGHMLFSEPDVAAMIANTSTSTSTSTSLDDAQSLYLFSTAAVCKKIQRPCPYPPCSSFGCIEKGNGNSIGPRLTADGKKNYRATMRCVSCDKKWIMDIHKDESGESDDNPYHMSESGSRRRYVTRCRTCTHVHAQCQCAALRKLIDALGDGDEDDAVGSAIDPASPIVSSPLLPISGAHAPTPNFSPAPSCTDASSNVTSSASSSPVLPILASVVEPPAATAAAAPALFDDAPSSTKSSVVRTPKPMKMAKPSAISKTGASSSKTGATKTKSKTKLAKSAVSSSPPAICEMCKKADDGESLMVGCDRCENWYHGSCVNITYEEAHYTLEEFICPCCKKQEA